MSPARKTVDPEKDHAQMNRAAARDARARLKQEAAASEATREQDPLFRCPKPEEPEACTFPEDAMRLGFAVKVMGKPGLKSNDTRRWQKNPHLQRLAWIPLRDLRVPAKARHPHVPDVVGLGPYATHPDMPQFHNMVQRVAADLAQIGRIAREQDLRLSAFIPRSSSF